MKRRIVLLMIVAIGMTSIAVSAWQLPQGPTPASLKATTIDKVKDNLFVITGSGAEDFQAFSGGNTAVFITDKGVVLVDTKLPGWGPTIVERVKTVTDKPIVTIINTHTHGDHTGSNEHFANVEAVVHENTKANMAKMPEFSGAKAKFLPARTYKDRLTLGQGKDQVDLYYFGPGHTSGDTFVVFPAVRTMHAGDMFAWKALPLADVMNGGTPVGHAQSLAKAVSTIKNVDTVITGHTPVLKWTDFTEYAQFSADFVTYARASIKANKTPEQAAKEYQVPAKYKGYVVTVNPMFVSAQSNLEAAYAELKK